MTIFLLWPEGKRALWNLFYDSTIPFVRGSPLWPNNLSKAPPPHSITLNIRFSIYEFRWDTNTQSRAVSFCIVIGGSLLTMPLTEKNFHCHWSLMRPASGSVYFKPRASIITHLFLTPDPIKHGDAVMWLLGSALLCSDAESAQWAAAVPWNPLYPGMVSNNFIRHESSCRTLTYFSGNPH